MQILGINDGVAAAATTSTDELSEKYWPIPTHRTGGILSKKIWIVLDCPEIMIRFGTSEE